MYKHIKFCAVTCLSDTFQVSTIPVKKFKVYGRMAESCILPKFCWQMNINGWMLLAKKNSKILFVKKALKQFGKQDHFQIGIK